MKKKDCNNIETIKLIGREAIKIAINDYKNNDLAIDVFEQIGRVLFFMQKERKKYESTHTKRKKHVESTRNKNKR